MIKKSKRIKNRKTYILSGIAGIALLIFGLTGDFSSIKSAWFENKNTTPEQKQNTANNSSSKSMIFSSSSDSQVTNYNNYYSDNNPDTTSGEMPILQVIPISFVPYHPPSPKVPGQYKAKITCEIILRSNQIANNIRVKFDIEDKKNNHRVDSVEWNDLAKQKPVVFSMSSKGDKAEVSWTPDIANAIKDIAQNKTHPFILRLLVSWEDIAGRLYKRRSYSYLRYNEQKNTYYFDEKENVFE